MRVMSTQLHHFADGAEIRVVSDTFHELSTLARRNAELEQANRQLELDVQRLERLVYLDPLTGLGNRRHFDVVIASELRRAARTSEPLTLLICDVDRFKVGAVRNPVATDPRRSPTPGRA